MIRWLLFVICPMLVVALSPFWLFLGLRTVVHFYGFTVERRIPIQATSWVAEVRSTRCSIPIACSGPVWGMDIRVIDGISGHTAELVEGADVLTDNVTSEGPGMLNITLANLTVAKVHDGLQIPGLHITWDFTPKDEPAERKAHLAYTKGEWAREDAQHWYCANVFPTIVDREKAAEDQFMANRAFKETKVHYCLPD